MGRLGAVPSSERLVVADLALLDAALEGDDALGRALGGCGVVADWQAFPDAAARARSTLAGDPGAGAWGTRLFVRDSPRELVGWGGFKGPPSDGAVEIGYAITPARRGAGLATAAAQALLAEAYACWDVRTVLAHTLRERKASVRVLERIGFRFEGEASERGMSVWRFRHERPA